MNVIETRSLVKKFNGFTAVAGIDLSVAKGEIFGLLGPNGAGKTTFLSMLCTILSPSEGQAFVNGFDVTKQEGRVRKSIGIVFQDPSIDDLLTGRENLQLHARLYGLSDESAAERIELVLQLVDLKEFADKRMRTYSGGMRRRLEIARGLLHDPEILFLDEPTIGLDPQTREHIWSYIKKLNEMEKVTIVLTTHYMEEADLLCNRIAIVDKGKIVALNTPANLKKQLEGDMVSLRVEGKKIGALVKKLSGMKIVQKAVLSEGVIKATVGNGEAALPQLLKAAYAGKFKVLGVDVHKPTLNDVFLHYTGREIRDTQAEGSFWKTAMRRGVDR